MQRKIGAEWMPVVAPTRISPHFSALAVVHRRHAPLPEFRYWNAVTATRPIDHCKTSGLGSKLVLPLVPVGKHRPLFESGCPWQFLPPSSRRPGVASLLPWPLH
jgi:hypothetical protein